MAAENNESSFVRQIAYIVQIKDILSSEYTVTEGWNPNYISVNGNHVSRTNIIGTIISDISEQDTAESKILSFDLDDGSGSINVRLFNETSANLGFAIGDTVLLIGRVREYNSERYLALEIWKKLKNKAWVEYRKKELTLIYGQTDVSISPSEKDIVQTTSNSITSTFSNTSTTAEINSDNSGDSANTIEAEELSLDDTKETAPLDEAITKQALLDIILKDDSGDGVSVEHLCKIFNKDNLDSDILDLLKHGEIFEIKPGFVKIL